MVSGKRRLRKFSPKLQFEKSRNIIVEKILSQKPKDNSEVDIERQYRNSTRTLDNYITLDWNHKQDIRKLINTIKDYSDDKSKKRPLNIIMIADPGSGKSHFVNCLANKLNSANVSAVNFNMGIMHDINDLLHPIENVRNLKVVDRLPILFLDEFDSKPTNYSILLPLLWDGELQIGSRILKIGKAVIIMAGSDPKIKKVMKTASNMNDETEEESTTEDGKKIIDLLSRINGGVLEIPGLETTNKSRDRRVDKICIALSLLKHRFSPDLQLVPWNLLHFIGLSKFCYGVRSITHLTDFIKSDISNEISNKDLILPLDSIKDFKNSSLIYHLNADGEPENVISFWEKISQCNAMVRFQPKPEIGEDIYK